MAASLFDLIAQKDAIERQILEAQSHAKAAAITRVRELMAEHGLSALDFAPTPKRGGVNVGFKVAPKYRDPVSGAVWTGRGLRPKWLTVALSEGKSVQDFAI